VIFLGLQENSEFMPKFYVALRASSVTFPKFNPKFICPNLTDLSSLWRAKRTIQRGSANVKLQITKGVAAEVYW